jgi:hypothetical protein
MIAITLIAGKRTIVTPLLAMQAQPEGVRKGEPGVREKWRIS